MDWLGHWYKSNCKLSWTNVAWKASLMVIVKEILKLIFWYLPLVLTTCEEWSSKYLQRCSFTHWVLGYFKGLFGDWRCSSVAEHFALGSFPAQHTYTKVLFNHLFYISTVRTEPPVFVMLLILDV
jgi:hypothetical protein